jgi:hypothetical protein
VAIVIGPGLTIIIDGDKVVDVLGSLFAQSGPAAKT